MIYKATHEDIVKYARTWIGTRWQHQGRNRRGIDCAGMLVVTMNEFGLPCQDLKGYRRDPGPQFVKQIRAYTDPGPNHPINGAIGIFSDSTMPCHTGIFAVDSDGRVTVIHSEVWPKRSVHEEGYDDSAISLKDRLVDIRLFKEVDYVQ